MPFLSDRSTAQLRSVLGWYIGIRLAVVCFFAGGTILYQLQSSLWQPSRLLFYLGVLVVLACLESLICVALLPGIKRFRQFIHSQVSWDLLLVTTLLYMTGGVESFYSFLYILVIISSSIFLPRAQVLVVASASAILYGSLIDLQYYGYLPLISGQAFPIELHEHDVFYAVFLHVGAFFLTALLSGNLAERLRRSEAAREQREVDFGELEKLNQAILENINSGLMIVNPERRILSFNNSASKITGYELEDVYNRPVDMFFPEFSGLDLSGTSFMERGEANFTRQDGNKMILGYSASPVEDAFGKAVGQLIAFQDLTEYKTLEAQLKRADRLAAVGRLASGMAHEIRNPLASISGSVQLLMEDPNMDDENRRLMGIVVREADRLSLLLSDFLNFARPSPLCLEKVDVAFLLDELISLFSASGQFSEIQIEKAYESPAEMMVDRLKIRQATWDLLLNAAEAVQPSGKIRISLAADKGLISIEDSGSGIDEQIRDNIFEPFFTTKEKGTGLGLANVYANIEAHNGRIYIEPGSLGGAKFNIELPLDSEFTAGQEIPE
jgi:two-component system sensor histidine kinase PilS (NtrC family)